MAGLDWPGQPGRGPHASAGGTNHAQAELRACSAPGQAQLHQQGFSSRPFFRQPTCLAPACLRPSSRPWTLLGWLLRAAARASRCRLPPLRSLHHLIRREAGKSGGCGRGCGGRWVHCLLRQGYRHWLLLGCAKTVGQRTEAKTTARRARQHSMNKNARWCMQHTHRQAGACQMAVGEGGHRAHAQEETRLLSGRVLLLLPAACNVEQAPY
jgi:hypothetical protein